VRSSRKSGPVIALEGPSFRVEGDSAVPVLTRRGPVTALVAEGNVGAAVVEEVGTDGESGRSIVVFTLSAAGG